ncbi:hypothetical protein C6Q03_15825 [Burkholderia multivorans]|nr:hypothetical protein C6Q03_15825 [Burkholderia multivorans]
MGGRAAARQQAREHDGADEREREVVGKKTGTGHRNLDLKRRVRGERAAQGGRALRAIGDIFAIVDSIHKFIVRID